MISLGNNGGEAKVRYLDGDYKILAPGSYVTCAITGERIALQDLKYWSVDRQEAYADAAASYKAYLKD